MNQPLEKYQPQPCLLYSQITDPLAAIERIGMWMFKSAMFGASKPEEAIVLALAAYSEGVSVFEIKRRYHLIEGNLAMKPEVMLARFIERGGKHKIVSQTPDRAEVELIKDGETNRFRLTWEEAQLEPFVRAGGGKLKYNWATPRARMQTMWWRVVSQGVRSVDPGVMGAMRTAEEVQDDRVVDEAQNDRQLLPVVPVVPVVPVPAVPEVIEVIEADPQPVAAPSSVPQAPKATVDPKTGLLDAASQQAILSVIPDDAQPAVMQWLTARGWIKTDQTLAHLTIKRAQSIIDRPQVFLDHVGAPK